MSIFKNITRGGQLQIHQLRMFHQIFNFAFLISLLITLSFVVFHINKQMQEPKGQYAYEYAKAKFLVSTIGKFSKISNITQMISLRNGQQIKANSINILRSQKAIMAKNESYILLIQKLKQATGVFSCSFIIIFVIWFKYGQKQKKTDITKGKSLVSIEDLSRDLKKDKIDSDIIIEGLPLVKNSETQHILVAGTTGCGKSNLFNIILPQIRRRPNRAIIVDVTGSYVSKFYNPETDLIFNPLDSRTVNWNIWADCHHESHYESFAASIIPDKKGSYDDIWDKSARLALVELMKKMKVENKCNIKNIFSLLNESKLSELDSLLEGTPASKLFAKEAEKTAYSILMNLMSQIAPLKYLNDTIDPFSIRNWVGDEASSNSWLFITSRTDQIDALKPLITSITDIAINAMLSLEPDARRRLWFVIDELPKLNKMPSLITALAESRKYGGCILAGIQSIPQLTEIYGYSSAQIMLDMFNSFFFFRCQNPQTTQFVSTILGVVEQEEHHEQMSYGASSMKDGVSFSKQARSKSLVLPTEIANLKNLEAYVKYASHDLTKLKMKYHELPTIAPGFILQENTPKIIVKPVEIVVEENPEPVNSNENNKTKSNSNEVSIVSVTKKDHTLEEVIEDVNDIDVSSENKELLGVQ